VCAAAGIQWNALLVAGKAGIANVDDCFALPASPKTHPIVARRRRNC
jgi:hypothetical protein